MSVSDCVPSYVHIVRLNNAVRVDVICPCVAGPVWSFKGDAGVAVLFSALKQALTLQVALCYLGSVSLEGIESDDVDMPMGFEFDFVLPEESRSAREGRAIVTSCKFDGDPLLPIIMTSMAVSRTSSTRDFT
ncbi:unnamed protein product [Scytosiphon promiscuus]